MTRVAPTPTGARADGATLPWRVIPVRPVTTRSSCLDRDV